MTTAVLTPAYGRDYKSQKDVREHWEDGKDFVLHSFNRASTYVNINQLKQLKKDGYTQIQFRFQQQRKLLLIKI